MTWFTVETVYSDDAALLERVRPTHRAYLTELADAGQVVGGGPFADGVSGFTLFAVADRAELDRLLELDPYTTEGVAASRTVREWKIVVGELAKRER